MTKTQQRRLALSMSNQLVAIKTIPSVLIAAITNTERLYIRRTFNMKATKTFLKTSWARHNWFRRTRSHSRRKFKCRWSLCQMLFNSVVPRQANNQSRMTTHQILSSSWRQKIIMKFTQSLSILKGKNWLVHLTGSLIQPVCRIWHMIMHTRLAMRSVLFRTWTRTYHRIIIETHR